MARLTITFPVLTEGYSRIFNHWKVRGVEQEGKRASSVKRILFSIRTATHLHALPGIRLQFVNITNIEVIMSIYAQKAFAAIATLNPSVPYPKLVGL